MRLLLVSDNHGNTKIIDQVLRKEKYDISIHLGDSEQSESWIKRNFDYYVGGNHDQFSIEEATFEIEGIKFAICHGHTIGISMFSYKKTALKFAKQNQAQVVLIGHLHWMVHDTIEKIKIISPGALHLSRGPEGNGYCIMEIDKQEIKNVTFKNV